MNIATSSPAVRGRADSGLADLVDEVIRRFQAGESIDPDALAGHDPQRAEHLRRLLPTLEKLADLGSSATSDHLGGPPAAIDTGPGLGVLGDFHLLREVGRGGMGIVYEAQQLSLHRRVALKVLPFAAVTDPKQLQRFQVEAQAAAQLHHTNIVPVFAVGCERGVHYYAMQFIEGETLAQVIEELRKIDGQGSESHSPVKDLAFALASGLASGSLTATEPGPDAGPRTVSAEAVPLPAPAPRPQSSSGSSTRSRAFFENAARLGIQAAEALEHAHQQGVLHRDIKPSNLLVDARGNIWITDFGLARLQSEASLTLTGDIMGTLRYMSPEQAMAKRVVIDHRTDIYSLGATFYELMTLRPVFEGDDRQALLRQIAFTDPKPLRKWNPSLPRDLETIVLKSLSKDPSSRFNTAQELADDLRRFLEDRPIKAKRPTLGQRAAKWARRHTAIVYSALVLLSLAVMGLSAGILMIGREQSRTAQIAENLRRRDYVQRINLALREIQDDGNVRLAESLLDGCPADLRGWEWNYVRRQAHLFVNTYNGHREGILSDDDPSLGSRTIACVAISPDGKWAASGTGFPWGLASRTDRVQVRLWKVDTGADWRIFDGLAATVQGVAISPDGKLVAATGGHEEPRSEEGWLKLWDTETGKEIPLRTPTVSGMVGMSVAFSPDGRFLAVGYGWYLNNESFEEDTDNRWGRLTLIEIATGEEWTPERATHSAITGLAYSPNPDRSLIAISGKAGVEVWDWKARQFMKRSPRHGGNPICDCVAFSSDGRTIALGGADNTIRLWEPDTNSDPRTLYGHKGYVLYVAFSPDGSLLASVSEDRSVRLWEVATARELAVFHGHGNHVFAVAFHPDGRRILSGGIDAEIRIWDVRKSRPVVYHGHSLFLTGVEFSRDGRLVASVSDPELIYPPETTPEVFKNRKKVEMKVWDPDTGEDIRPLAVSGSEPAFYSFDGQSRASEHPVRRGSRIYEHPVASPDRRRIFRAARSYAEIGNIQVIDAASGRVLFTLVGHTAGVFGIAFSPDGRRIATACTDRTVKLWDSQTGQEVLTLRDHTGGVTCLAFSPDGNRLVSGSFDRTARIWDATPLESETSANGATE
jgi:WD40 repeat protein/serine/threonine protein kinase